MGKKVLAAIAFIILKLRDPAIAQTLDYQSVLESLFRNSIVKIDVSAKKSFFVDNENVCLSSGTGFVLSSSLVITAEHVFALRPECGEPVIIVKSRKHNMQRLATVVDATNDAALLRVSEPFPKQMCALRVRSTDEYNVPAFRFGIPGSLQDPTTEPVRIQDRHTEFDPLAVLRPSIAEPGESGGPVIFMFNVIGITRARHPVYRNFSFMTPGQSVRDLLSRNAIQLDGAVCSPVEAYAYFSDSLNATSQIRVTDAISAPIRREILANAADASQRAFSVDPSSARSQLQDFVNSPPVVAIGGQTLEFRTRSATEMLPPPSEAPRASPLSPQPPTESNSSYFDAPQYGRRNSLPSVTNADLIKQKFSNIEQVQYLSGVASAAIERDLWNRLIQESEPRRPGANE